MAALKVGDSAPDFEVPACTGETRHLFRLSQYAGRNVVLTFYPLNWTPV